MKLHYTLPLALAVASLSLAQSTWVGIGAGYNGASIPNLNVTMSFAARVSMKAKLWSFTSADYASARTKPFSVTNTLRTGLAYELGNTHGFHFLEFMQVGGASVPGGIVGSISPGGLVMWEAKSGYTISIDIRATKNATQNTYLQSTFMMGYSWGN